MVHLEMGIVFLPEIFFEKEQSFWEQTKFFAEKGVAEKKRKKWID